MQHAIDTPKPSLEGDLGEVVERRLLAASATEQSLTSTTILASHEPETSPSGAGGVERQVEITRGALEDIASKRREETKKTRTKGKAVANPIDDLFASLV